MNFTRESIFISVLRGFFKSFAVVLGIALGIIAVVIGVSAMSNSLKNADKSELTLSADANWSRKLLPDSSPVILKINVHGVIGALKITENKFKTMLLDSREGVLANDRVKGILISMNSPGGSATESSAIYELFKTYKEKYNVPIYVYVDGLCASGGMYISCAADQIYASSDSIIGSVGVRIGPAFNFATAMDKVGIRSLTITEGKDKDSLNPFRPWKEGEGDSIKAVVAESYELFVDAVTAARKKLSREKLVNEYGANVFAAQTAKEHGYIDNGNASYNETLVALVKAAGLDDKKYQVIEIEPTQSVLADLAEKKSALLKGKIEHVFPTGSFTTTEMSGQLLYLYQP